MKSSIPLPVFLREMTEKLLKRITQLLLDYRERVEVECEKIEAGIKSGQKVAPSVKIPYGDLLKEFNELCYKYEEELKITPKVHI